MFCHVYSENQNDESKDHEKVVQKSNKKVWKIIKIAHFCLPTTLRSEKIDRKKRFSARPTFEIVGLSETHCRTS